MLEEIIQSLNLPPWLYLPAAILATLGTIIIKRVKNAKPRVKELAQSLQRGLMSTEKIDASVEWFLTKIGIPEKFANYAGDIIAQLVSKSPQILELPRPDALYAIAGLITATGAANVKKILPRIPDDVNSKEFARRRFIYGLLGSLKPGIDDIAELANGPKT